MVSINGFSFVVFVLMPCNLPSRYDYTALSFYFVYYMSSAELDGHRSEMTTCWFTLTPVDSVILNTHCVYKCIC